MSPFNAELAVTSDYLATATDLHKVVAGNAKLGFHPKVRGTDPEDGAIVGVAYYELDYPTRAEAAKRATELLRYVKALRSAKPA